MEFGRQEYWNELAFHPLGDLPDPGNEPESLMYPLLAGRFFTSNTTWEAPYLLCFSRVQLCATPWTAAHQAPLSLGFSLQARTLEWVAISFSSA